MTTTDIILVIAGFAACALFIFLFLVSVSTGFIDKLVIDYPEAIYRAIFHPINRHNCDWCKLRRQVRDSK
jgi:hypothetical protein